MYLKTPPQKALLFDLLPPDTSEGERKRRLQEFKSLINSRGGITCLETLHVKGLPHYQTYIDPMTVDRIIDLTKNRKTDMLIINNILKPSQIFTLSEMLRAENLEVWDRVDLILNIFSAHAQSSEANLQIELAKIRHMGPRIFGMGSELSRQGGGIGTSGIGETNIERMKRHLKEQDRRISAKLKKVETTKDLQRQRRQRQNLKTLSVVGYTNAGKSTLMKNLTHKQNVSVGNALFVTLDTRIGRLFLPQVEKNVLISDTIGFIADLPPKLIAAFTSTLSEVLYADLLLHVVDVSDPARETKIQVVDTILQELHIEEKPQILVFNKTDLVPRNFGKVRLQKKYSERFPVFISSTEKQNLEELKSRVGKVLFP